ncbi:type II secretion system GspH family protein [Patescibacteria group bacterium]|nr:type II secretion system GspH family protein [Patescibacteria group bacterium]
MPAKIYKAFTMIELLIVIAVLGILAVAVLSAINPIEQINRSRDTGNRSDSEQLISAIDRYYANNGFYPWTTGASDTATALAWTKVNTAWKDSGGSTGVLGKLSQSGTEELKASFIDRISGTTYNFLYAQNNGLQGSSTYVCFLPKSASFKTDASTRCAGTLPTDYPPTPCAGAGGTPPVVYTCLP